ncbi:hypothetical protein BJP40_22845 [Streptomyces sp. CC53]|uniref:hypothetical protein n=1 Tax=unclassified Streptomyces TaxID=2593676 RepID=UPI0008DD2AD7|nr:MULTISPECIES: hypothetical protein [unclassified Streptomyces]OII63835.1 hypothetical protein BJP40_22845 [Streptomyces sp. CC53]OII69593.1 hypothetical protein BJP39_16920 [Streptomyces sp. CC77]
MPGIDECLLEAMTLPGARGAALVDWTSGLALGAVGESPVGDHGRSAAEAAELARTAAEYECFAAQDAPAEDVIVGSGNGYHVLRFVVTNFESSLFLHLWLDRDTGNLALARLRLRDLAERLVL